MDKQTRAAFVAGVGIVTPAQLAAIAALTMSVLRTAREAIPLFEDDDGGWAMAIAAHLGEIARTVEGLSSAPPAVNLATLPLPDFLEVLGEVIERLVAANKSLAEGALREQMEALSTRVEGVIEQVKAAKAA